MLTAGPAVVSQAGGMLPPIPHAVLLGTPAAGGPAPPAMALPPGAPGQNGAPLGGPGAPLPTAQELMALMNGGRGLGGRWWL
jgi:hypothetical protein